MHNLLIPVDGSPPSIRALEAAIAQARIMGDTRLSVINVQPPILSGNVTRFFSAEDIHGYYQDEGRNAMSPARPILQVWNIPRRSWWGRSP